jgi:hypothetical protein
LRPPQRSNGGRHGPREAAAFDSHSNDSDDLGKARTNPDSGR